MALHVIRPSTVPGLFLFSWASTSLAFSFLIWCSSVRVLNHIITWLEKFRTSEIPVLSLIHLSLWRGGGWADGDFTWVNIWEAGLEPLSSLLQGLEQRTPQAAPTPWPSHWAPVILMPGMPSLPSASFSVYVSSVTPNSYWASLISSSSEFLQSYHLHYTTSPLIVYSYLVSCSFTARVLSLPSECKLPEAHLTLYLCPYENVAAKVIQSMGKTTYGSIPGV